MKYYPKDSSHIDYVESLENTTNALVVKAKNFSSFIKIQNISRYIIEESGSQITVNFDPANLRTCFTFTESQNYITFFRILTTNAFMSREFSQQLHTLQFTKLSLNSSFQSPLANPVNTLTEENAGSSFQLHPAILKL